MSLNDDDDSLDNILLLHGNDDDDDDDDNELLDFLCTNLSQEMLKAELDAEAIDKIMCELENSALYCVPVVENLAKSSSSSSNGKRKTFPLSDRLRYLINAPLLKDSMYKFVKHRRNSTNH